MGQKPTKPETTTTATTTNTTTPAPVAHSQTTHQPQSQSQTQASPTKPTATQPTAPASDVRRDVKLENMTVEELFNKYSVLGKEEGDEDDTITGEGIMEFASDVNVDPMDILLMVLFWKLNAEQKYTITRREFVTGFTNLRMENIPAMRSKIPSLKSEIQSKSSFKNFYMWCFQYMKEATAKTLTIDLAVPTWKLILKDRYKYIDEWCKFIEEIHKKAISHDTWEQFLDFTQTVGSDFSKFDADGAWPVAIDEFVEYMNSKKNDSSSSS